MSLKTFLSLALILNLIALSICQQQAVQAEAVPFIHTDNHGYQADGSMDLTFAKSAEQKNQFIQNSGKVHPGTMFLQHLFQTDGDDDFHFTLPVDQQIAFYAYAYVVQDNTYVRVKNVEDQAPIRLAVYEAGQMIVKTNFYFQKYIIFDGKKDSKYELKFQTSGKNKLISLSLKLFVQTADIQKSMKKSQAAKHSFKTTQLKSQLTQLANKFGVYWIIDQNNLRHSVWNVRRYYAFQVVEMMIVALASYLQITTLFKLLRGNSIIV